MSILTRCVAVLLGLCLLVPTLLAGTTGKIAGVVRDSRTKEPLPGVNIVVQGTALGASSSVDGRYVILNVAPGRHKILHLHRYLGRVNDLRVLWFYHSP